jgi:serine phosphatase RsbU (regulator of sigma subunit)
LNQPELNTPGQLHGPVLVFIRAAWLLIAALIVGILLIALPFAYARFQIPCQDAECAMQYVRLTPQSLAELQPHGISVGFFAAWNVGLDIAFASVSFVIATVIFWRKSNDAMALFVSFTLLLFGGVTFSNSALALGSASPVWQLPIRALSIIGVVCFSTFLCVFPNGRFVPHWMRWVAIVLGIGAALSLLQPNWHLFTFVLFIVVGAAQVYRYRHVSDEFERQQTKWVVFGIIAGVGGYFGMSLIGLAFPWSVDDPLTKMVRNALIYGFMLLVPLSIGAAILRSQLYDIDLIIRRTLIYGALTGILAGAYFACLFLLQNLLLGFTAQSGSGLILASSASALTIAALSRPVRERVQNFIDRRFYRQKYDATNVIAGFGASLRDEVDLDRLTAKLLTVAQETMQPEHSFLSVVRVAADRPPSEPGVMSSDTLALSTAISESIAATSIHPDDPLAAFLRASPNTVALSELRLESPALHALRSAKVQVTTPLVSQGELVAILSLGAHLSQQDYSRDDLKLLDTLAAQAAPAVQVAKLVREQRAQEERRARLDQELQLARRIQLSLLPKEMPALAGWQLNAFYQPAREVGGDFYDFIPLPDGRLGIAIGDVTGKGMPAALCMATTRTTLRATAQSMDSPGDVLARVNTYACQDVPIGMFITCLYAILNPATGSLHFANAGHDLPYQWHGGSVTELHARGMPLGLMPGSIYEENQITILRGQDVIFYTDGVVEAHNQQHEMFGISRLEKLLAQCSSDAAIHETICEQLTAFTGKDWEQEDDITMVTLRRMSLH